LRAWTAKTWADIVDHVEYGKHLAAGTSVEVVQHFGGVAAYAAKYVGKSNGDAPFVNWKTGEPISPGRFWGVWRRELLEGEKKAESSDEISMSRVRRVMRKYAQKRGAKLKNRRGWSGAGCPSFSAFLPVREIERLMAHYMPWRKLGMSFEQFREIEIEYRRELYLAACWQSYEYPPPRDYVLSVADFL